MSRPHAFLAFVVTLALTIAACSDGTPESSGDGGGGTMVFATLYDPTSLDPQMNAGSIPTWLVTSQVFETLVELEVGTARPVPGLARSWETADGRTWTFRLHGDVTFHDGTALDAAAVCFNFERWYNFKGVLQAISFWVRAFEGHATSEGGDPPRPSLYQSCEARAGDEVVITLTRPYANLPLMLTVPGFAIASPDALRRYEADKVSGTKESPRFEGTFATEHPIGSGPFKFGGWIRNDRLTLLRNDDYWGDKAKLERVIIRPIADSGARRTALETGEIDGYPEVGAADLQPLRQGGFQVLDAPPANVGCLVLNRGLAPLDDLRIRQAIAAAIDRESLVRAYFPPGTDVAAQYLPPAFRGHVREALVTYDPERARRLLEESGVGKPLELWYLTGAPPDSTVPNAEAMFLAFKANLERVGFTVVGRPVGVAEGRQRMARGEMQVFFTGFYAGGGEAEELLRVFRVPSQIPGTESPELSRMVDEAAAEVDPRRQTALYEAANRFVTTELVGAVPYAHARPAVAVDPKVEGFRVGISPYQLTFETASMGS